MRMLPAAVDGQRALVEIYLIFCRAHGSGWVLLCGSVCVSVQPSKPCMRTVTPSLLRKQLHLLEGWVVMM